MDAPAWKASDEESRRGEREAAAAAALAMFVCTIVQAVWLLAVGYLTVVQVERHGQDIRPLFGVHRGIETARGTGKNWIGVDLD